MRKLVNCLPLIFAAMMICLGISACSSPLAKLSAPSGFSLSGKTVTWEAVENAAGYAVEFNNKEAETAEPRFTLPDGLASGDYTVEVLAIGDYESYEDSEWTKFSFTIEKLSAPSGFFLIERTVAWDAVENAVGYAVEFNNQEIETAEPRFTLPYNLKAGDYTVKVLAIGGTEAREYSEQTTFSFTLGKPPAQGYDYNGFLFTLLPDGSGYEFSRGKANLTGTLTIPAYFKGLPVKKIADEAFYVNGGFTNIPNPHTGDYCNVITTAIKLPDTVTEIGKYAFACIIKLEEFTIPDTVTQIGNMAFYGCISLKRVTLPSGLKVIPPHCFKDCALSEITFPDGLEEIGYMAFESEYNPSGYMKRSDQSFTKIELPNSVKKIGQRAFFGCIKLKEINLPDELEFMDWSVFDETAWLEAQPDGLVTLEGVLYGYKGDMEEGAKISIPSGIEYIAGGAFSNQKNLAEIVIPYGAKFIGENIFKSCSSLKEVELPADLTEIPSRAFFSCKSLVCIDIPSSVTDIGESAFAGCSALKEITLHNGLKSLGKYVFQNCTALEKIVLPSSLNYLGFLPFNSCEALLKIYYEGTETAWNALKAQNNETYTYSNGTQTPVPTERAFSNAAICYYSASEPTEQGNYWHYDSNGNVIEW